MLQKPRKISETFLNWKELTISIIQGMIITAGVLFIYQWTVYHHGNEEKTRAMVFTTLIFANILLSLANRSFYYSLFESFSNRNILFAAITGLTLVLLFVLLYIPAVSGFFRVTPLSAGELLMTGLVAAVSVLWFEIYKWQKRRC